MSHKHRLKPVPLQKSNNNGFHKLVAYSQIKAFSPHKRPCNSKIGFIKMSMDCSSNFLLDECPSFDQRRFNCSTRRHELNLDNTFFLAFIRWTNSEKINLLDRSLNNGNYYDSESHHFRLYFQELRKRRKLRRWN